MQLLWSKFLLAAPPFQKEIDMRNVFLPLFLLFPLVCFSNGLLEDLAARGVIRDTPLKIVLAGQVFKTKISDPDISNALWDSIEQAKPTEEWCCCHCGRILFFDPAEEKTPLAVIWVNGSESCHVDGSERHYYDESRKKMVGLLKCNGLCGLIGEQLEAEHIRRCREFMNIYPPGVRDVFDLKNRNFDPRYYEEDIKRSEDALIKAIPDPVERTILACRALAFAEKANLYREGEIAFGSIKNISDPVFLRTLKKIRVERPALHGAARLYHEYDFNKKIPDSLCDYWTAKLAQAYLTCGAEDYRKIQWMEKLLGVKGPETKKLLSLIAEEKAGKEIDPEKMYNEEPSLRACACLFLAERGDASIKKEVTGLLKKTQLKQDRAALELALVFLGEPRYIRMDHFQIDSYTIRYAGLRALEKYNHLETLNTLMAGVFRYGDLGEEADLAKSKIIRKGWRNLNFSLLIPYYSCEIKDWAVVKKKEIKAFLDRKRKRRPERLEKM
jgi:hypothetical protein